jgi:hypothetical protein
MSSGVTKAMLFFMKRRHTVFALVAFLILASSYAFGVSLTWRNLGSVDEVGFWNIGTIAVGNGRVLWSHSKIDGAAIDGISRRRYSDYLSLNERPSMTAVFRPRPHGDGHWVDEVSTKNLGYEVAIDRKDWGLFAFSEIPQQVDHGLVFSGWLWSVNLFSAMLCVVALFLLWRLFRQVARRLARPCGTQSHLGTQYNDGKQPIDYQLS